MAGPADVDGLHRLLIDIGVTVLDPPDEYPQCGQSFFFADPDGLNLEFVYRGSKVCSRSIA
jgi:hypothetical protein